MHQTVLGLYGDWLFERREFRQAASGETFFTAMTIGSGPDSDLVVFVEANMPGKAMVAHERALEWQQLFDLAMRHDMPQDDIVDMGYRVAGLIFRKIHATTYRSHCLLPEDLCSKKRFSEAARILVEYSKDVREATIALVQGNHFAEARRIVSYPMHQSELRPWKRLNHS